MLDSLPQCLQNLRNGNSFLLRDVHHFPGGVPAWRKVWCSSQDNFTGHPDYDLVTSFRHADRP